MIQKRRFYLRKVQISLFVRSASPPRPTFEFASFHAVACAGSECVRGGKTEIRGPLWGEGEQRVNCALTFRLRSKARFSRLPGSDWNCVHDSWYTHVAAVATENLHTLVHAFGMPEIGFGKNAFGRKITRACRLCQCRTNRNLIYQYIWSKW